MNIKRNKIVYFARRHAVYKKHSFLFITERLGFDFTAFFYIIEPDRKNPKISMGGKIMFFGDGSAAAKAAADAAKAAVRSTANFDWTFIALLALVVVGIYVPQIKKKNWNGIAAALALYGVHWLYEIVNAVIGHYSGYALWTVSADSTTWIILIGVSWELSMMFSVAGFTADLLPEDKSKKILGINNRIFFAIASALGFSLMEIFLASTPSFIWVYKWWGAIPVFITVYIPFFLAAYLIYDKPRKTQKRFCGTLWAADAVLMAVLIPLGII